METIDVDRLRKDLIEYFGTAMSYNPVAMMDLIKIEKATDQEIINIALNNNINLNDYVINTYGK